MPLRFERLLVRSSRLCGIQPLDSDYSSSLVDVAVCDQVAALGKVIEMFRFSNRKLRFLGAAREFPTAATVGVSAMTEFEGVAVSLKLL